MPRILNLGDAGDCLVLPERATCSVLVAGDVPGIIFGDLTRSFLAIPCGMNPPMLKHLDCSWVDYHSYDGYDLSGVMEIQTAVLTKCESLSALDQEAGI